MKITFFSGHNFFSESKTKGFTLTLIVVLVFGYGAKNVLAEDSASVLYVPLIGITSVPEPLALPQGPGKVTYNYAVKNFLREVSLTDIVVVDDKCSQIEFITGDDNNDSRLDYSETWRYRCVTKLSTTTESVATATGVADNITATHKAFATVVVGSSNPAPLVNIVNITKVAYPLSLPAEGGQIIFIYKVNNPGVVPLSGVIVSDDKCSNMSGKLGDTNGNNLLDINEVWIYTCTTILKRTTTSRVQVVAFANGLRAVGEASVTVKVKVPVPGFQGQSIPNFPETGGYPKALIVVWGILSVVLITLIMFFVSTRLKLSGRIQEKSKPSKKDKKL